jgi:hypothetical protein
VHMLLGRDTQAIRYRNQGREVGFEARHHPLMALSLLRKHTMRKKPCTGKKGNSGN